MNNRTSSKPKIKTILLLIILILSLLPLALSAAVSSIILKDSNEKTFKERGDSLNNIVENTITNRILQYEQLLSSIELNGDFENEDYISNELAPEMKLIQDSNDQIINVYYAKEDGRLIQTASGELPEGFNFKESEWYIEGMRNPEKKRVERPYKDKLTNEMITSVYKTVKVNNKADGILAIDIRLNDLSEILSKIKYGQNSELIVADPENSMVVFCGNESKVATDEPARYSIWNDIINSESGSATLNYEGVKYEVVYTTSSILDWKIILKEPKRDLNFSIFRVMKNNIISIVILAVISIFIALSFTKKMSDAIIDLKNNIGTASKGKFNIEIMQKSKTYELASLTESFNHMLRNISSLMADVDNSISVVNNNSNEAFEISRQISESIVQVSETISQISQGNVECSENLEEISEKIISLSNSMNSINTEIQGADEISKKADDLSINGTKMIDIIKEKSAVTKSNSEEVKAVVYDVAESVESISDMNSVIRNIASQTNLLALNAAIEAARAGESGRGFAVVSDEIVKLAEETGKSAKQIELVINSIKQKTNNAVKKVNETTEVVISQEEVIDKSGGVFDGISDSVKELTERISVIRDEVISVNVLKDDVLDKVENLSAIVEETAAGAEEVTASAEEVAATSETFMSEFDNLKETVDDLSKEVSKFEFK
ncbi:MAG: methyl-accepting chemotaxis protein [Clostridium sp.]|nr:methyl-accepting chemotaxis protein [Clostridium sp.]